MPQLAPSKPPAPRVESGVLELGVQILPQPDETTCGPTCLDAVYRFWGRGERLSQVIDRTRALEQGGTFAVWLACDALRRGFAATIYTYNITVFDPTWFTGELDIAERLQMQREHKPDFFRLQQVTDGYLEFLELGGRLRFVDLTTELMHGVLRQRRPIITGLSATYLYRAARGYGPDDAPDDVRGLPVGHFVIIAGYNALRRTVLVVDPYQPTPYGPSHYYWISLERVIGAILLGIVTHDANLLVIHPSPQGAEER